MCRVILAELIVDDSLEPEILEENDDLEYSTEEESFNAEGTLEMLEDFLENTVQHINQSMNMLGTLTKISAKIGQVKKTILEVTELSTAKDNFEMLQSLMTSLQAYKEAVHNWLHPSNLRVCVCCGEPEDVLTSLLNSYNEGKSYFECIVSFSSSNLPILAEYLAIDQSTTENSEFSTCGSCQEELLKEEFEKFHSDIEYYIGEIRNLRKTVVKFVDCFAKKLNKDIGPLIDVIMPIVQQLISEAET